MPIVLVTVEGKEQSGYTYDDRTGIAYEYPKKYDSLMRTGERFVYNKPRAGYAGTGIIGAIRDSQNARNRVCEILDHRPFNRYVSLKNSEGDYYEADPAVWKTGNVYWAKGVRPISSERFEAILSAAEMNATIAKNSQKNSNYASPDVSKEVDLLAMEAALVHVRDWYPGVEVSEMPKNNPGFDIRVGEEGSELRFVEVKGTQSGDRVFFLSEGERKFSMKESSRYSLVVVTGIDIERKTYAAVSRQDGHIDISILEPSQWRGRLPNVRA